MRVISFVNMKGGVAKTTLAVNVADCLVRRHDARVLVIDVDPQFNATQTLVSGDTYVQYRAEGGHTMHQLPEGGCAHDSVLGIPNASRFRDLGVQNCADHERVDVWLPVQRSTVQQIFDIT